MKLVELAGGGSAVVVQTDGERVVLLASVSLPPGSPLEARLGGETLRLKVRGCRRIDPDEAGRTYRIEGRLISLSRSLRRALSE